MRFEHRIISGFIYILHVVRMAPHLGVRAAQEL